MNKRRGGLIITLSHTITEKEAYVDNKSTDQTVYIGDDIKVTLLKTTRNKATIRVVASPACLAGLEEMYKAMYKENEYEAMHGEKKKFPGAYPDGELVLTLCHALPDIAYQPNASEIVNLLYIGDRISIKLISSTRYRASFQMLAPNIPIYREKIYKEKKRQEKEERGNG